MKRKREISEDDFADQIAKELSDKIRSTFVETRKSVLYSITFDDSGRLDLHQNENRHPLRGLGKGFQQDILAFETVKGQATAVIPRVILEVKLGISSHGAIIYSEKARRIKSIYPYVRYGLVLANKNYIPAKVIRLGPEFDFIYTISLKFTKKERAKLVRFIRREIFSSKKLAMILNDKKRIGFLYRQLKLY